MMKRVSQIGEIRGDSAFDAFSRLIPVLSEMAKDEDAVNFFSGNGPETRLSRIEKILEIAIRNKQGFKEIEAIKRGCSTSDFEMSAIEIHSSCTELMKDPIFLSFFVCAHRDMEAKSSTSAPDPTVDPEI